MAQGMKASDLVTPASETRAGFVNMAIEKNYLAVPYIQEAIALKVMASKVTKPSDLLTLQELRSSLLTASGVSVKSLAYLTTEDQNAAIIGLIEKFLDPAGNGFVDELVYRFLLTKGDALGGQARNLAGTLGERKFLRSFIAVLGILGIDFKWKDGETGQWIHSKAEYDTDIEKRIRALCWTHAGQSHLLLLNVTVPFVGKNVDVIVLRGTVADEVGRRRLLVADRSAYLALGELKGGIDPAGADEHWKTARTALARIATSFADYASVPKSFFVGAAIQPAMAAEIVAMITDGTLTSGVNLCSETQLTDLCHWLVTL